MLFETFIVGGILYLVQHGYTLPKASRSLGQIVGKTIGSGRRIKAEAERLQYQAEESLYQQWQKNKVSLNTTPSSSSSTPKNSTTTSSLPSLSSSSSPPPPEEQMLQRWQQIQEIRNEALNILNIIPSATTVRSSFMQRYTSNSSLSSSPPSSSSSSSSSSSPFTEHEIQRALTMMNNHTNTDMDPRKETIPLSSLSSSPSIPTPSSIVNHHRHTPSIVPSPSSSSAASFPSSSSVGFVSSASSSSFPPPFSFSTPSTTMMKTNPLPSPLPLTVSNTIHQLIELEYRTVNGQPTTKKKLK